MKPVKLIIAPDSFKGAISSLRAAEIIAEEVSAVFPECEIVKIPIADGGEGSIETILAAIGGTKHETTVISPDDREITAAYGIASNGSAIVEMAQSSGITKQDGLHPMTASTYGFGQLILAALEHGAGGGEGGGGGEGRGGAMDAVLCIGGSATTDGGAGMAAALGVRFFDAEGGSFIPCGATLGKIARIDMTGIDSRVADCKFIVMCDVENPLYGTNGAAYIYGPQKGATPEQVIELDAGLRHLAEVLSESFGKEFAETPGAGAAGGLGAGCMVFLGAKLMSGIDTILKLSGFREHLAGADLVITGEGKLDAQSFSGKVLSGIEILCNAKNVPVWSICGVCEYDKELLRSRGIVVFETSEGISIEESMSHPEKYLRSAAGKAVCELQRR